MMDELTIYNLSVKYPNTLDLVREVEKMVRADAIDNCKTILKAHHMRRTYADDFVPRVEIPFYRGLWESFNELKEQNSNCFQNGTSWQVKE